MCDFIDGNIDERMLYRAIVKEYNHEYYKANYQSDVMEFDAECEGIKGAYIIMSRFYMDRDRILSKSDVDSLIKNHLKAYVDSNDKYKYSCNIGSRDVRYYGISNVNVNRRFNGWSEIRCSIDSGDIFASCNLNGGSVNFYQEYADAIDMKFGQEMELSKCFAIDYSNLKNYWIAADNYQKTYNSLNNRISRLLGQFEFKKFGSNEIGKTMASSPDKDKMIRDIVQNTVSGCEQDKFFAALTLYEHAADFEDYLKYDHVKLLRYQIYKDAYDKLKSEGTVLTTNNFMSELEPRRKNIKLSDAFPIYKPKSGSGANVKATSLSREDIYGGKVAEVDTFDIRDDPDDQCDSPDDW